MFTQYWWSSGAAGKGFEIKNSLRFRGAQNLVGPPRPGSTFTYSVWFKLAGTGKTNPTLVQYGTGGRTEIQINNGGTLATWSGSAWYNNNAGPSYRDVSAWYHLVSQYNSGVLTQWINGQQLTLQNPSATLGAISEFIIGSSSNTPGSSQFDFEGYMADVYCIDGQAILPTAFGRELTTGQWVPREVDFTPAEIRRSDQCFTSPDAATPDLNSTTRDFFSSLPITQGFDGNDTTWAAPNVNGSWTIYRPEPKLENVTSLRILSASLTDIWINGSSIWSQVTQDASKNVEYNCDAALTGGVDITSIAVKCSPAGRNSWRQITTDTGILTIPFIWSAQCFTSAATASPDLTSTEQNWEAGFPITNGFDGNLANVAAPATAGGWSMFRPNTALTDVTSLLVESQQLEAIWINGSSVTVPTPGGASGRTYDLTSVIPAGRTIENLSVKANAGQQFTWYGITINGQILTDGVNSSYGANGFHLDFSDPDDLGADKSGNNNDFTATGFNTTAPVIYSSKVDTTGTVNAGIEGMFDGNTGTNYAAAAGTLDLKELGAFLGKGVTKIDIKQRAIGGTNTIVLNSQTIPTTGSTTYTTTVTHDGSPITTFTITGTDSTWVVNSITVNGVELVDNPGQDYDLMTDSPTQNWAVYNNVLPYNENSQLFDGNLRVWANTGNAGQLLPKVNFKLGPGSRIYLEHFINTTNGSATSWNLGLSSLQGTTGGANRDLGRNPNQVGIQDSSQIFVDNAQVHPSIPTANQIGSAAGNYYMMAIDYDSGLVWYGANGTWWNWNSATSAWNFSTTWDGTQPTLDNLDISKYPFITAQQAWLSGALSSSTNYGQKPFLNTPPTGFSALQTQNLPAAPIKDGREHFETIDASGANILFIAQSVFSNGLWWIKDRDNVNDWQFVDSVRGGNLAMQSNRATAELAYAAPAGNSVAYCWNATGAAVTNNDGSIATQVSANTDAGFSIITHTGNGANAPATIGHGLTKAPEFVIVNFRNTGANRTIYHKDVGNRRRLLLNTDLGQSAETNTFWNSTSPNNAVITLGSDYNQTTVFTYATYAWHSVPGYSAFGSYTANNSADGPFIYTGFRSAWILIKATGDISGGWGLYDSTRFPSNPANGLLYANSTNKESAFVNRPVDILSNGFKIRDNNLNLNSSGDYIYAAFSENPFGSSNTSPANAR